VVKATFCPHCWLRGPHPLMRNLCQRLRPEKCHARGSGPWPSDCLTGCCYPKHMPSHLLRLAERDCGASRVVPFVPGLYSSQTRELSIGGTVAKASKDSALTTSISALASIENTPYALNIRSISPGLKAAWQRNFWGSSCRRSVWPKFYISSYAHTRRKTGLKRLVRLQVCCRTRRYPYRSERAGDIRPCRATIKLSERRDLP